MKIWYPITFGEFDSDDLQLYIMKCQTDLCSFRIFLKSNFNNLRWNLVPDELKKVSNINLLQDIKPNDIANQYINSLQCH